MDLKKSIYSLQTLLKVIFLPMSLMNAPYTIILAIVTSVIGVLRVLKTPQLSKDYAQKLILNNHGQNLLYIAMASYGYVNYMFYAPIVLFFFFGIVEYANMYYPGTRVQPWLDLIRNNKFYIYEGKGKLEIVFWVYMLVTLPLDFFNRLIKVLLLGQYLMLKFRISAQFRYACTQVNQWIEKKTSAIGFINNAYKKVISYAYDYATRVPAGQQ